MKRPKATIRFGTFGPNDAEGGRPMLATIDSVEIGQIERIVTEEFRSASSYARKIVVLGYRVGIHPLGFRRLGADEATIDRISNAVDDKEFEALAQAKNALREAVAREVRSP